MCRSLAYIVPLESIRGAKFVNCNIHFVAGSKSGLTCQNLVSTDFFKAEYYGFALEVVTTDRNNCIREIADLESSDFPYFGLSFGVAVGYDGNDHSIESQYGFRYKLKDTVMCRKLGTKCIDLIEEEISRATNLGIFMYLLKGALIGVSIIREVKENEYMSKFAMGSGYAIRKNEKLSTLIEFNREQDGGREILRQRDIDELLERMREDQGDVIL